MDRIDTVICDAHPLYNTSNFAEKFAEEREAQLIKMQHHFAHAMSVMAEKNMDRAVGIAVDGVGYGFDGTIWGCEVLKLDLEKNEFRRTGRLELITLPGGDLAVRYPLRTLFSVVYNENKDYEMLKPYEKYLREKETFEMLAKQVDSKIALASASSAGRYLDAISAMLETCFERTYEGEPAMKLEAVVEKSESYYRPEITSVRETCVFSAPYYTEDNSKGDVKVLRINPVMCDALERYQNSKEEKGLIAHQLIDYLAKGIAEIASKTASRFSDSVVMSGGVAYNSYFTPLVENYLKDDGLKLYLNKEVAAGDNGISLGQLYIMKYIDKVE